MKKIFSPYHRKPGGQDNKLCVNRAIFIWVSKMIQDCFVFCFTSLCVIGPENTSIRFKTKTNCDFLVTLVFLRFMHFACFYLRFSLHSSSWYFFSYASLAAEIALILISRRSIESALMWHTIHTSFAYRTHLQRLIVVEPKTCVTYDPNVSQDLIRPMIFFQSSKIQHLTCHRKVLGSNFHLEVRFPSFPTLTWHHFSSMVLYFRASS